MLRYVAVLLRFLGWWECFALGRVSRVFWCSVIFAF